MQKPSIGRIVHYTLSAHDAEAINRRRADYKAFEASHAHPHVAGQPGGSGYVAHVGNPVAEGAVFPATIVRIYGLAANLQVHLDGNDTYWATSRCESEDGQPSTWCWPPRV